MLPLFVSQHYYYRLIYSYIEKLLICSSLANSQLIFPFPFRILLMKVTVILHAENHIMLHDFIHINFFSTAPLIIVQTLFPLLQIYEHFSLPISIIFTSG